MKMEGKESKTRKRRDGGWINKVKGAYMIKIWNNCGREGKRWEEGGEPLNGREKGAKMNVIREGDFRKKDLKEPKKYKKEHGRKLR